MQVWRAGVGAASGAPYPATPNPTQSSYPATAGYPVITNVSAYWIARFRGDDADKS